MQYLVNVSFVPVQQEAIAALMPAEQAHVRKLLDQGVFGALHIAADRSHIWVAVNGESEEDVRQTMSELPLYPYMQLEYTPLLDLAAARSGNAPEGGAQ